MACPAGDVTSTGDLTRRGRFPNDERGEAARREIRAVEGPRRAEPPAVLVADPTQAKRDLGWEPRFTALQPIVATGWVWTRKMSTLFAGRAAEPGIRKPNRQARENPGVLLGVNGDAVEFGCTRERCGH
ncbi:TPA: hypothetical protein DCY65_02165 [Candidatus Acetothermia bacterium]|nr:hypothetical protein [Candidatus Acetothermia bacterium]